jgi:tripartite-type tricarboxylate transporter receptor subunit TctC
MACALGIHGPAPFAAEAWPSRTITIVAPGAAGGTSDLYARLAADGLSKSLGQPVIVENKIGVGTLLGAKAVAQAKPDGHTLLIGPASLTISPYIYKTIEFDPIREVQPIRVIVRIPNVVVVNSASSIRTVADLLSQVRANPGKFNYASGGVGISEHLAGELFKAMTGADLIHVPFKSSSDSALAVVKGEALVAFGNLSAVLPQVQAGKLRAIAVTSSARYAGLPDLPTVAEQGVAGYEVSTWFGLFAPAGTPPQVVRRIDAALQGYLATPETRQRLRAAGAEAADVGPDAFAAMVKADYAKWGPVVRNANIRAE